MKREQMKTAIALLSIVVPVSAVLPPLPAQAQTCGLECHVEFDCFEQAYPCGSNPDGTVMMCLQTVCEPYEVCEPKPCTAEPLPDGDPPELPEFPDFPELPDFPDFPPLF
jgi:hypothetical protein